MRSPWTGQPGPAIGRERCLNAATASFGVENQVHPTRRPVGCPAVSMRCEPRNNCDKTYLRILRRGVGGCKDIHGAGGGSPGRMPSLEGGPAGGGGSGGGTT